MVQGFTTDAAALHEALNDPKCAVAPVKPDESRSVSVAQDDVHHLETLIALNGLTMRAPSQGYPPFDAADGETPQVNPN
jgi:hypothetical protein